ncbi:MAG: Zn-dependent exopeptidase M28 [Bacteroidia bacterium]|nr:MAG: Zn-dependent exopeptidase M28 [Bacteroidia bacterium]
MKNRTIIILPVLVLLLAQGCSRETAEEKLHRRIENLVNEVRADSLESYVNWLEEMGTRFCLAENRREVAVKIMNRLKGFGYNTARLDSFFIERIWQENSYAMWQYNVVATLPGTAPAEEISILGAHYDNYSRSGDPFVIAPGAHDNGSGVAALMEIARIMKQEDYRPSATIEFVAFGAEEMGLYGSWDYAGKLSASGKKVRMMLNNDMIAYEPSSGNTGWLVNIINYPSSVSLLGEAREVCDKFTILGNYTDNTHQAHSDSYPFAENGFPALFFYSGTEDPYYHTESDLASNLNFEYCSEITGLCCALLVWMD